MGFVDNLFKKTAGAISGGVSKPFSEARQKTKRNQKTLDSLTRVNRTLLADPSVDLDAFTPEAGSDTKALENRVNTVLGAARQRQQDIVQRKQQPGASQTRIIRKKRTGGRV